MAEGAARFVVFADMLGFAQLTEMYDADPEKFREFEGTPANSFEGLSVDPRVNPLVFAFTAFHVTLGEVLAKARPRFDLTSVSFSDSVFISTELLKDAVGLANQLMVTCLTRRIPIRIGIGHGSFATIRFKADMSLTGGEHAAQFLGTAVVRAHAAERCGIKGMRILLHPEVLPYFLGYEHNPRTLDNRRQFTPLPCAGHERNNSIGLTHEINYLMGHSKRTALIRTTKELRDAAPQLVRNHYDATLAAMRRMTTQIRAR